MTQNICLLVFISAFALGCVADEYGSVSEELSPYDEGAAATTAEVGRMSASCDGPPTTTVLSGLLKGDDYQLVIVNSMRFGERISVETVVEGGVITVERQEVLLGGTSLLDEASVPLFAHFAIQSTRVFRDSSGNIFHEIACPEAGDPVAPGSLYSRLRASEGVGVVVLIQHTRIGDLIRNVMPWDGRLRV